MQKRASRGNGITFRPRVVPEVIGWETTLRCNMRCRHCGSTAGAARQTELSTAQSLGLVGQIAAMGVPRVCLTGGETLMRPDWREIVDALLDGGVEVGLLTNGWLLTNAVVGALAGYSRRPVYVSVSIDGLAAAHDDMRAKPGSFARAMHGAMALKTNGVPVAVITTVSRRNVADLPALREWMLRELKPYCWQIQVANTFGRAEANPDCTVGPVEHARTVCFTCETRRMAVGTETRVYAGDCLGYLSSIDDGLRDAPWAGCQAGLRLLGIQSNGNVKGCLSIIDDRLVEGNALVEGLEAIWTKKGAFAYTRCFDTAMLEGTCAGCAVGEVCRGGCTAASVSVYGRPHRAPYCLRAVEALAERPGRERRAARAPKRTRRQAQPFLGVATR